MNPNWHNATKARPCPVCGHGDWCAVSNDGMVACCRRVESARPARSGMGWIHFLADRDGTCASRRIPELPSGFESKVWSAADRDGTADRRTETDVATQFDAMAADAAFTDELALRLGLAPDALAKLDMRRDPRGNAAFPMRNAEGTVTGVRLRVPETGRKFSVKGSKDGLFYAKGFQDETHEEIVVLEGPSDTAAAVAAFIPAVGRSSCLTGGALVNALVRRCRTRRITIVADNDAPKPRPGGGTWQPGLYGAKELGKTLRVPYRIILPPCGVKDFREWSARFGMCAPKFFHEASACRWKVES